jgi:hypothetical protein
MKPVGGFPDRFSQLTTSERSAYLILKQTFADLFCDWRKLPVERIFPRVLRALQDYITSGELDAQHRKARVCGICWLGEIVATNTSQLPHILGRSKSWINSAFQALRYAAAPDESEGVAQLNRAFPSMRRNYAEARQWTYRCRPESPAAAAARSETTADTTGRKEIVVTGVVDTDEDDLWPADAPFFI